MRLMPAHQLRVGGTSGGTTPRCRGPTNGGCPTRHPAGRPAGARPATARLRRCTCPRTRRAAGTRTPPSTSAARRRRSSAGSCERGNLGDACTAGLDTKPRSSGSAVSQKTVTSTGWSDSPPRIISSSVCASLSTESASCRRIATRRRWRRRASSGGDVRPEDLGGVVPARSGLLVLAHADQSRVLQCVEAAQRHVGVAAAAGLGAR